MRPSAALLRILLAGVCNAAVAGCASAPPVPLRGSPPAVIALAGEWDGTYTSRDTGRSGSIWLKLTAGEDHAHGDVLMTPRGRTEPYYRYPSSGWPAAGPPADLTQVLTIQFVHASDGTVDGRLEPYWDPDCECEAITAFRGRLHGDRLEGTFNTRLGSTSHATGRWVAYRRRVALRGDP